MKIRNIYFSYIYDIKYLCRFYNQLSTRYFNIYRQGTYLQYIFMEIYIVLYCLISNLYMFICIDIDYFM